MSHSKENNVCVLIKGKEVFFDKRLLCESIGVSSPIRIMSDEFADIQFTHGLFGHFNLSNTKHIVGEKYLLVKIIRNGISSGDSQSEVGPLLSLEDAIVTECVEVQNNIPFEKLDNYFFMYPMKGVTDQNVLFDRIRKRYKASRPDFTPDKIRSMGVGYTLLRYIQNIVV